MKKSIGVYKSSYTSNSVYGIIFITVISTLFAGCFAYYYKTNTQQTMDASTLQRLQSLNKYFIVHFENTPMALQNVTVKDQILEADLIPVAAEHSKHLRAIDGRANRVKKFDKEVTFLEVHLYYPQPKKADMTHLTVPLSAFNRVDIYGLDKGATTANHVLSAVGIGIVATGVITLIVFAIACNCPQVYVNNGEQYEFISGLYSGAVYSSLERTDYLPLPSLHPVSNRLDVRINNAPSEKQFINKLQLIQVDHPSGVNVLADRQGNFMTYGNTEPALDAVTSDKNNVTFLLQNKDQQYYSFTSEPGQNGFSNVILSFNKPEKASTGKLVIHARNSNWSGYLYKEFASLFGDQYETWRRQREGSDPKEMEQWQKDQALPIMVYAGENDKWEFINYFQLTGNTASRDMIMQIDLSKYKNQKINIKLESTYMFWDLDFAGMDFTENKKINITLLDPVKAEKSNGSNELPGISKNDDQYTTLADHEALILEYNSSGSSQSSYFLAGTGYYHSLQKFEGKANINELIHFRKKGAFDDFSRAKFSKMQEIFVKSNVSSISKE